MVRRKTPMFVVLTGMLGWPLTPLGTYLTEAEAIKSALRHTQDDYVVVLATEQNKVGTDWSPDGRFLLYRVQDPKMGFDIWALPLEGDQKPFPVLQTSYEEREPQFSPDGKWIAYQSNETGRFEIYVQMFPGLGSKSPITDKGRAQPRWRHDGKELFYIAPDSRLMAVPIRFASNAQTVEVGTPVPMFAARLGETVPTLDRQQYIVSADGERFLLNTVTSEAISPITVVLNWNPSAKK